MDNRKDVVNKRPVPDSSDDEILDLTDDSAPPLVVAKKAKTETTQAAEKKESCPSLVDSKIGTAAARGPLAALDRKMDLGRHAGSRLPQAAKLLRPPSPPAPAAAKLLGPQAAKLLRPPSPPAPGAARLSGVLQGVLAHAAAAGSTAAAIVSSISAYLMEDNSTQAQPQLNSVAPPAFQPAILHPIAAAAAVPALPPSALPVGALPSAGAAARAAAKASAQEQKQEQLEEALDGDVGLTDVATDEQTFSSYVPTSFTLPCFHPHPDEIFETSSMACLPPPKTTYTLNICSQTILRGFLTNAQLEAISLACSQHELRLPGTGERAAFFLGDGPGVGKGRQAAGIIFENYLRGRKKALWFSASPDLVADARRDLNDIGAECVECYNLKEFLITDKLDDDKKWENDRLLDGVLFCTYTLLTSDREVGKRIDQVVEWCGGDLFDGPLILDECHKAKNMGSGLVSGGGNLVRKGRKRIDDDDALAGGSRGKNAATKTATFVAELQERLPLARIVYVSATGASEPKHFMQLSRLGLWGPTTSFKDADDFVDSIKKGGVGAMELLAMHMKASGQYISRSLSFSSATFELINVEMDNGFKKKYDGACKLWSDFILAVSQSKDSGEAVPKFFMSIMWGAHQRFFAHMIMAAKVPTVVKLVKKSIDEGKCCVIGLQATGEASNQDASQSNAEEDDIDEINSTAASNFTRLVDMCKGFLSDAECKSFLRQCDELNLPPNPLDDMIFKLGGPRKVAEMTGRKMRFERKSSRWEYVQRCKEKDSDELTLNIEERKNFQDGKKLVAIISEACSSGISLQADRRVSNQRRRVHITMQLPWAADQAVQQMGRSHRSNQTSAPEFKLLMTTTGGERRFASAVASRLQSLGALTRGDRNAAGTGGTTIQSFSIEGKYGKKAVKQLINIIFTGRLSTGEKAPEYVTEMFGGEDGLDAFCKRARPVFTVMALEPSEKKDTSDQLKRFMNRLLGVPLDLQNQIFDFFTQLMDHYIKEDKLLGQYQEGICDVAGKQKRVVKSERLYECPRTGSVTDYVQLSTDRGVSWEEAIAMLGNQKIYSAEHDLIDDRSGFYKADGQREDFKYLLAILRKQPTGVKKSPYYIWVRPNIGNSANDHLKWELRDRTLVRQPETDAALKKCWDAVFNFYYDKCTHIRNKGRCPEGPTCQYGKRTKKIHLITGLCLPFWKELSKLVAGKSNERQCKVVRVQPDDGSKRLVGILVLPGKVDEVIQIIKRGTQSDVGLEDRAARMKDSPFYEEIKVVKLHDCLNPTGQDVIPFDLPEGWEKAGDGSGLFVVAQVYEIPFQNALDAEGECAPLYPTFWRTSTQLSVLSGTEDVWQTVRTPMPPRRIKGWECGMPIKLNDVARAGSNKLRITSVGERFCVVVKIMRELSLDEAVKRVVEQTRQPRDWSKGIINKMMGNESDDCVVTELNVSIKCPLSCGRIKTPCRGLQCEHFNSFDLGTYLEFCRGANKWVCPVCSKAVLPWDLAVCPIFECILETVAAQPAIESCTIDKSGNISTGSHNVKVKVKDGAGQRKHSKEFKNDDDAEVSGGRGQDGVRGMEDGQALEEQKMDMLKSSGLWQLRQEAEDQFTEPVNVLAAQENVFDDLASPVTTFRWGGADSNGAGSEKRAENDEKMPAISLSLEESDDDSWLG